MSEMTNNSRGSIGLTLTEREVATIVAALRNWQMDFQEQDLEDAFIGHFKRHEPLDAASIDAICERLAFDESQGFLRV